MRVEDVKHIFNVKVFCDQSILTVKYMRGGF